MEKDSSIERRECVLDGQAWERLISFLEKYPRTEKFGLGIGIREAHQNIVLAYIWPKQEANSNVFCQIRIEDLGFIMPFLVDLREEAGLQTPIGVCAWVHTHPQLGIFLSGTDKSTFANWAAVDPGMLAIVIDAFQRAGHMVGVFAPDLKETKVWTREKAPHDCAAFFQRLLQELPLMMKQKDRPLDALITPFGAWSEDMKQNPRELDSVSLPPVTKKDKVPT